MDLEILAEALADAGDHVVEKGSGQSVQSARGTLLIGTRHNNRRSVVCYGDVIGKFPAELAFWALDTDFVSVCDSQRDFVSENDGCFSNTGHG